MFSLTYLTAAVAKNSSRGDNCGYCDGDDSDCERIAIRPSFLNLRGEFRNCLLGLNL